jgi:hypothetical protein
VRLVGDLVELLQFLEDVAASAGGLGAVLQSVAEVVDDVLEDGVLDVAAGLLVDLVDVPLRAVQLHVPLVAGDGGLAASEARRELAGRLGVLVPAELDAEE